MASRPLDRARRLLAAGLMCGISAAVAAWLYAPYGLNGLDDGFLQALAWRVLDGQRPYVDFVYVRPPGSLLLHALVLGLLPSSLSVIGERVGFYFTVAVYSFVATGLLTRAADTRAWRLPPYVLPVTAFVVAVQDFPPMPWHTVDGVLFAVLAVAAAFGTPRAWGAVVGALLALAAASCKQPFFIVPPALGLGLAWCRGRRQAWIFCGTLVAGLGLGAVALVVNGAPGEALAQWTAASRLASLVHSGLVGYVRAAPYLAAPLLGGWLLARGWRALGGAAVPPAALAWIAVLWIFGWDIARTLLTARFQTPAFNYPAALWLVAAAAVALGGSWAVRGRTRPTLEARITLGLLLVVAWAASISWGYPTPVLLAAPLVFGSLALAAGRLGAEPRRLLALALPLALAAQFVGYRYPYREAPRSELTERLGTTFGRLSHVRASAGQRARLEELKRLHARFPVFTVLPGLPAAHLLTGSSPPVGIDWARNAETAGRDERLIAELEASGAVVFLERSREPPCRTGPGCSTLAAWVATRWEKVETHDVFDVYRRPETGTGRLDRPPGVKYVEPAGGDRE